jgi:thiamine-phosphate pyrophosphorylase
MRNAGFGIRKKVVLFKKANHPPHAAPRTPHSVWRLLDANANRAREGLRVVEDTARFVLERADAARALRSLRHRFDELVRDQYARLLKHRDVENDPGRKNASSRHRDGIAGLLASNFKRCEEALRVLEEYGRIVSPRAVREVQAIRYQVYQWEKKLGQIRS